MEVNREGNRPQMGRRGKMEKKMGFKKKKKEIPHDNYQSLIRASSKGESNI